MKPLKVKILNDVRHKGSLHRIDCVTSDGRILELNWFSSDYEGTLEKSKFYVIPEFAEISEFIYKIDRKKRKAGKESSGASAVFEIKTPFKVDEATTKRFNEAPSVTIPEVLNSPQGRRVSVEGTATVYAKVDQKQAMRLFDERTRSHILIKFWGMPEMAPKTYLNRQVEVLNVAVGVYKSAVDLNSTPETKVVLKSAAEDKEDKITKELELEIIARRDAEVVTDTGDVYSVAPGPGLDQIVEGMKIKAKVLISDTMVQILSFKKM